MTGVGRPMEACGLLGCNAPLAGQLCPQNPKAEADLPWLIKKSQKKGNFVSSLVVKKVASPCGLHTI